MDKNVLVVDDISINRKLLINILSKSIPNVSVIEAEDGLQALDLLAKEEVNAVLLDIMMPNMDGLEVLQRIKSNPSQRHIPVIMCTAVYELESVEKALSMGALDYFTKPLTEEQIKITLPLKVKNALEYYDQKSQLLRFYDHIKDEMQLAKQIQKSQITDHAVLESAEFWGHYFPCEEIGGDIYGCKQVGNRFWFMIADITGHGISAAMVSTMFNVAFNTSIGHCDKPGQVLENINQTLYEVFGGKYVLMSAFIGCIEDNVLSYANAGHPYPVHISKTNKTATQLVQSGFLLGMFQGNKYETVTAPIDTDDIVLLYTDGLYENGMEISFMGWDMIHGYCKMNMEAVLDPPALVNGILEFFTQMSPNSFVDDVAILAIRKLG